MIEEKQKLHLISLGCAKNLVDSEILLGGLKHSQYDVIDEPDEADTIIVNTCDFLDIAREESVDTILQAAELKKIWHCQTTGGNGLSLRKISFRVKRRNP